MSTEKSLNEEDYFYGIERRNTCDYAFCKETLTSDSLFVETSDKIHVFCCEEHLDEWLEQYEADLIDCPNMETIKMVGR